MIREEAIKILKSMSDISTQGEAIDMAIEALSEPSIVRCKDCRHLFADNGCPLRTWHTHAEDDFCSYGERGK